MKTKVKTPKLSLDKETIARLNTEQLADEQTQQIRGGATAFTACGVSCTGYTSSCGYGYTVH